MYLIGGLIFLKYTVLYFKPYLVVYISILLKEFILDVHHPSNMNDKKYGISDEKLWIRDEG